MNAVVVPEKSRNLGGNLGNRSLEVRPVGAWVQSEVGGISATSAAALSAASEEAKIERIQREKAVKLKKFQKDVGKRVRTIQKLKEQEQLASSCRAVEEERHIMLQSGSGRVGTFNSRPCLKDNKHQDTSNARKSAKKISQDCVINAKIELPENSMQNMFSPRESLATRQIQAEQRTSDEEETEGSSQKEYQNTQTDWGTSAKRSVKFDLTKNESNQRNRPHSAPPGSRRSLPIPMLNDGVQKEEEAVRIQRQRALYRRLFMDREREAVQQANRQKEEKLRVLRLKADAEKARKREERHMNPVAPRRKQPETVNLLEQEEQMWLDLRRSEELRQKKFTENARFVLALKQQLRDRVKSRKIKLPPLCCCSPSPFDTDPSTCANNCTFYHNPKAYTRALQALISAYEL